MICNYIHTCFWHSRLFISMKSTAFLMTVTLNLFYKKLKKNCWSQNQNLKCQMWWTPRLSLPLRLIRNWSTSSNLKKRAVMLSKGRREPMLWVIWARTQNGFNVCSPRRNFATTVTMWPMATQNWRDTRRWDMTWREEIQLFAKPHLVGKASRPPQDSKSTEKSASWPALPMLAIPSLPFQRALRFTEENTSWERSRSTNFCWRKSRTLKLVSKEFGMWYKSPILEPTYFAKCLLQFQGSMIWKFRTVLYTV